MSQAHQDYRLANGQPLNIERCPVCGHIARLWEYSEKPNDEVQRVVMCDNGGKMGGRDGLAYEGCLMYMPPRDFYCTTARSAVAYWNRFYHACIAERTKSYEDLVVPRVQLSSFGREEQQWIGRYGSMIIDRCMDLMKPKVDRMQIIYALERAEKALEAQAAELGNALDYNAEFPAEDAERMREAITILKGLP